MPIIELCDFDAPELDVYARLTERQLLGRDKPEGGLFIAESPKVIHRALDAGYEPVSLLMERRRLEGEERTVIDRCGDLPVYVAESEVLMQLTGFYLTRGTLCAMRRKPLPAVEAICTDARRVVVLEDIMNPTNLGAVFRSAAALGMDAVLLTPACSDPLYRRSARVSMGTVFQVPWTYFDCPWPYPGIDRLRTMGFRTAALALREDAVSVDDPRLRAAERLAVVLGTEGDGLADVTIAACDDTVRIPMFHGVDSLNVAAASAVAFWELRAR
ncbi:MAG: RNA methyltransferase [Oscillospiraceae bacterium]|nr:RNA methyltransferase [Oscillospiraceae bacterium]